MAENPSLGEKYFGNLKRRDLLWRVIKVSLKVAAIGLLYVFVAPFLEPVFQIAPEIGASLQVFVLIYVAFMVIGDLTAKTILHYVFNVASALLVLAYLVYALNNRIVSVAIENFILSVDLTTIYVMVVALSLLGLAKAFLQLINFLSERTESSISSNLES